MKSKTFHWLLILVSLTPLIYLAIVWPTIPDVVPMHYNLKMEPDRMGNKSELWLSTSILCGVSILVYLLVTNIQKIDPKRYKNTSSGTFNKIATAVAIFITVLNFVILVTSSGKMQLSINLIFCLIGLLFTVLGNYMRNLKPNYFVGMRLPWTLSDDENWKETHQLASRIWFVGGILLIIVSVVLPAQAVVPAFLSVTGIMVIIPVIYSYRIFRKKMHQGD